MNTLVEAYAAVATPHRKSAGRPALAVKPMVAFQERYRAITITKEYAREV
jgi:hypothetical protein